MRDYCFWLISSFVHSKIIASNHHSAATIRKIQRNFFKPRSVCTFFSLPSMGFVRAILDQFLLQSRIFWWKAKIYAKKLIASWFDAIFMLKIFCLSPIELGFEMHAKCACVGTKNDRWHECLAKCILTNRTITFSILHFCISCLLSTLFR